jgi:hypothetical protein
VFDDDTVATAVETVGSVNVEVTDEATVVSDVAVETTMLIDFVIAVPATPAVYGVTIAVNAYVPDLIPETPSMNTAKVAAAYVLLVPAEIWTAVVAEAESVAFSANPDTEVTDVAVAVSRTDILRLDVTAPVGIESCAKTTVAVSASLSCAKKRTESVAAVELSETAVVAVPLAGVAVNPITVAEDGATERTPRPNAATATSAMRLNVVFVDICFLSIVDLRNFRRSAWN